MKDQKDQKDPVSGLAETIARAFMPDGCTCRIVSDIRLDLTLTSHADPAREVTMNGIYIPSLLTSRAIANLVLEGRYLLSLAGEASSTTIRQEL